MTKHDEAREASENGRTGPIEALGHDRASEAQTGSDGPESPSRWLDMAVTPALAIKLADVEAERDVLKARLARIDAQAEVAIDVAARLTLAASAVLEAQGKGGRS